jgi:hypothetical protein
VIQTLLFPVSCPINIENGRSAQSRFPGRPVPRSAPLNRSHCILHAAHEYLLEFIARGAVAINVSVLALVADLSQHYNVFYISYQSAVIHHSFERAECRPACDRARGAIVHALPAVPSDRT